MLFLVSKTDMRNSANDNIKTCCWKLIGDTLPNLKYHFGYILKSFNLKSSRVDPRNFQLIILGSNTDIKVK